MTGVAIVSLLMGIVIGSLMTIIIEMELYYGEISKLDSIRKNNRRIQKRKRFYRLLANDVLHINEIGEQRNKNRKVRF